MRSSGGALLKSCYKESAYHCYGGFRLIHCYVVAFGAQRKQSKIKKYW